MIDNSVLKFLILYAAASSGGWLFIAIGISSMRDTRKREARETSHTTGQVVEHVKYRKRSRSHGRRPTRPRYYTYWRSVVAFTAEGKAFRAEGVLREGKPAVGETIDIWYDPDDPTHFHQAGQLEWYFRDDKIMIAIGVIWLLFFLFLTAKSL